MVAVGASALRSVENHAQVEEARNTIANTMENTDVASIFRNARSFNCC